MAFTNSMHKPTKVMPNPEHETFLTWLRDAYAFEQKLVPELKAHAGQAADLPDVQRQIQQHIAETEWFARRGIPVLELPTSQGLAIW